jgi:dTDP-4-amino-4,6-dideoxygalactose transaminase
MNQTECWIPHSASSMGAAETQALSKVIGRNFVGYGPIATELEMKVSEATGRKHTFAVSSGFRALALAVRALDLPRPSVIALPTLTCASVLAAVQGAGHHAWLTDIQETDLTIDPRAISLDAAAVIAPHAYGAPVDKRAVEQLGRPWIEDCATQPAVTVASRQSTASSTFAVFSFSSTKYITGGSGGMLLTDGDGPAKRVADLLHLDRFEKRGVSGCTTSRRRCLDGWPI